MPVTTSVASAAGTPQACSVPSADGRPWFAPLCVAAVGAAAVWLSSLPVPAGRGAARCVAPETLLSLFDVTVAVLLTRPGRRGVAESLALAALAAPFHAALAAPVASGVGAHVAFATSCAAWAAAALLLSARAPRSAPAVLAGLVFGAPLAGYGLGDFARLPAASLLAASPLTGPVLLAHRASAATAGDARPALVGAAVAVAVALVVERRRAPPAERGTP